MGKYKYLIKNIGLLTLSNFGTKLLTFFLVPLYTSVLSTSEYGTFDIIYTTISLLIPILSVSIVEATLRFSLDKNSDKQEIFSISLKVVIRSIAVFAVGIALNYFLNIFSFINDYMAYFCIYYVIMLLQQLLQAFARGIDRVFDVAVAGVINSVVMISLNIIFLLYLHLGLPGYFLAYIIGLFITCIYFIIRLKIWKYIRIKNLRKSKEAEMLTYSKPLVINSISWWINNASDRYVVTWICGIAANGIYSVGYKIPSILSVLQTIFNTAWQLTTVKAYNKDDSDGFFKNIYNTYNLVMVFGCSAMIVLTRFLARFLYAKDFYEAWRYVPFLMIAIVFGALIGVFSGVFQAVKDSKTQGKITVIGALTNLFLNIVLTICIGPLGAAIATAICYFLMWILNLHYIKQYISIQINLTRDYISYFVLVLQTILMLCFSDSIQLYVVQVILCGLILLLYFKEVKMLVKRLLSLLSKRPGNSEV